MSSYGNVASLGRALDPSYYVERAKQAISDTVKLTRDGAATVASGDPLRYVSIADRLRRVYEEWKTLGVPIGDAKNYKTVPLDGLSEKSFNDILANAAKSLLAHAGPIGSIAASLLLDG